MDVLEIIDRLEAVLVEERAAVSRLDGTAVLSIADQKLALAKALDASPELSSAAVRTRLNGVVVTLKQNGILLSHARAILSEALFGVPATMAGARAGSPSRIAARHVSVRG